MEPIATWNPDRQVWETDQADLFSERLEPYSATWQTSGMTLSGRLYPLPKSAPPTSASGSSSWPGLVLLPRATGWTPTPEPLTPGTAWMAGLFEGEGYISVRTDVKRPRVLLGLQMTDEDTVQKFGQYVGVGKVLGPYAPKGLGKKPFWRWTTTAYGDVEKLINLMWDGLCSRRRAKAIEAMTMAAPIPSGQMDLFRPPLSEVVLEQAS